MKYLKLFGALALLFSSPIFCDIVTPNVDYPEGEVCPCEVFCDTSTGFCDFNGDNCDECYSSSEQVFDGVWGNFKVRCYCYEDDSADSPNSPTAVAARQSAVLVYSSFNSSQTSALSTGTLGSSDGTYADKKEIFIIDGETPHTNEVEIKPHWCNK